ncbi:DNA double-strand break repair nuclease NurA [Halogeometricum luteum]|uniref:DNA double-strand break repair nuclease NurA n=1 Tax=Halogeometricum luteum TaxID=2950537 RepID=A0ABU2G0I9_9EURY|nr:DNA double-strand break repair nuclease NurA [Halogeometricum sp. S3BR5-2]MDS0294300.1 DNA double-strand break repair nuclease NurA [Halogeometricum sp. S3BR5-2]
MTLDPVHVDGIADLATYLARNVDDDEHVDLARTVWEEYLDPLYGPEGGAVLEPVGRKRLRTADVDDVALAESPFETVHGLDSGTINPTTFKNGIVLDVAQAAMAAVPSDLDLHRHRSIVATTHTNDATTAFDQPWRKRDEGYCRWRIIQAPRVSRFAEGVVHALSLYLAESTHALEHADEVEDLLVLDGPLYPKELLNWRGRDGELSDLSREAKPKQVVENYLRLVERFVKRDVPLCGFVKNPASKHLVNAVRERGMEAPWTDDTAFFTRLLERRAVGNRGTEGRETGELTFTNWFVSRGGCDRTFAAGGDAFGLERKLDADLYEVAFFVVYDPRTDVLYRVEAPLAFARDEDVRRRLTTQMLSGVAANRGPPDAVAKADELARISAREKVALRRKLEENLDSDAVRQYDDLRWAPGE